jgi:succinate dehydrogenase/fumarate reductase flavoprotein subunit
MNRADRLGSGTLHTDVLVIGGGPAATWAAESAATAGVRVVLVDKGYCGASGAAAASGNNVWYVPPGPQREASITKRADQAQGLADEGWMSRVVETTWERLFDLSDWGYPFPVDDGVQRRGSLQGPEYLRRMRRRVHRAGVQILDHHPALELLVDDDGVVSGAAGIARQDGGRRWQIAAGAVVLATGGCAFLSGTFGTNVDTGDGHLMAAEAGAELSGMEFSTHYGPSAAWGVHTKGRMLQFATLFDEHGVRIDIPPGGSVRSVAMEREIAGERVYASLVDVPGHLRPMMRNSQPNFFIPLEKAGIDVFRDRYPLRMVYEGTVRGTGGLRIVGDDCRTTVPGLFAAGDAATRELITGGVSGGGSHNAAWAISSGTFAGRGAARFAAGRGIRAAGRLQAIGGTGLRPQQRPVPGLAAIMVRAVQERILPPRLTARRTPEDLTITEASMESLWQQARDHLAVDQLHDQGRELLKARQAAAMVAHLRWITASALYRQESRGMHRRVDHPGRGDQDHRILVGGLDTVRNRPEVESGERMAS